MRGELRVGVRLWEGRAWGTRRRGREGVGVVVETEREQGVVDRLENIVVAR